MLQEPRNGVIIKNKKPAVVWPEDQRELLIISMNRRY